MEDNFDLSKLKKKKRLNSKNKGNTFQRKVAGLFNERFKTTEFCPTPGSGAFATTHNLPEYLKIHGDLITPQGFYFSLEMKKGYNKENLGSLFKDNSAFWEFWDQTVRDAKAGKKEPLLIIQQDRQKVLAIFRDVSYRYTIQSKYLVFLIRGDDHLTICELSDFFTLPDEFFFTE